MIAISAEEIGKIRGLFKGGQGAEVLRILNRVWVQPISYVPGDMFATAFNEGHRDVVLFLNNVAESRPIINVLTGEEIGTHVQEEEKI